jgi:tetratricopeptide (TPR) repeat protein
MGKRAVEPVPVGLVTSDAVQAGAKLRRRLVVGAASLVILGGMTFGGWYIWAQTSLIQKPAVIDYTKLTPAAAVKAAQAQVQGAHTSTEKQAAYTALGDAYTRTNQTSQSTAAYQQALTYSPDDIPLLENLSDAYVNSGDRVNAVKVLEKLVNAISASNTSNKDRLLLRYQAELTHEQGGQ